MRNPTKAILLAKAVCQQTQNQAPEALDVLASAFASNGNFFSAVETAEKALSLLKEKERRNSPIKVRLELFKKGKTFVLNP